MNPIKKEGSKPQNSGLVVNHNDEGLVIHERETTQSRNDGIGRDGYFNQPNYPLFDSHQTGDHGKNPWRND